LWSDILVIDKGIDLYHDSLLTRTATFLPIGTEPKVIKVHNETKLAYAVEFVDSLFLDSVVGYVSTRSMENKRALQFYSVSYGGKNLKYTSKFREMYEVKKDATIIINKFVYVAILKKGTIDTLFIKFSDYDKMARIESKLDSLKSVADKIWSKRRRRKVNRRIAQGTKKKFPVKAKTVKFTRKKAVQDPVFSHLLIDQNVFYQTTDKNKYNAAKYYLRGRKILYWIQKNDALMAYKDRAEYDAHVRLIDYRKQYMKEKKITGLKAKAILSGKIVMEMSEEDVVASIGEPVKRTPKVERFGTVQQIWYYKDFKLYFFDNELVKWE
jgi:hypothetical protein